MAGALNMAEAKTVFDDSGFAEPKEGAGAKMPAKEARSAAGSDARGATALPEQALPKQQDAVPELTAKDILEERTRGGGSSGGDVNPEHEALLRRAVSSVFAEFQGELTPLFEPYAAAYDTALDARTAAGAEQKLEYMECYRRYEELLEQHLERFAAAEGFESHEAFLRTVQATAGASAKSAKMLQKLLVAADYKKFCVFMRQACRKIKERDRI